MAKFEKRAGPDRVEPISLHGLRITVPHYGKRIGLAQNGGYIAAEDVQTGAHLWYLKVYAVEYNPKKEEDVQDLFICEMGVRDGMLHVKEEHGRVYAIDVIQKTVELVYSPFDKEKRLLREKKLSNA
jgi:hypothetical protein